MVHLGRRTVLQFRIPLLALRITPYVNVLLSAKEMDIPYLDEMFSLQFPDIFVVTLQFNTPGNSSRMHPKEGTITMGHYILQNF